MASAPGPRVTLWEEIKDYDHIASATAQLAFAAGLDSELAPATKGQAGNTDFDVEMKPPAYCITGLNEDYDTISAFWEDCLPPAPVGAGTDPGASEASAAGADKDVESEPRSAERWYQHSTWYWTRKDMTADDVGVLGGATHLHAPDVRHSRALLTQLREARPSLGRSRSLDVAGGVGRVTQAVLLPHFATVDITDVAPRLLEAAGRRIPAASLGHLALSRMSRLCPPADLKYDCIWMQWCLGYMLDADLLGLLRRLRASLAPGGVIIIKETVTRRQALWVDASDLNIVRGVPYFEAVLREAGLRVVMRSEMRDWPADYLPMVAWVCE